MSDGPSGLRMPGPSIAYASGIMLAATWNPALVESVGAELGRDARARGSQFLLGPGVNLHRSALRRALTAAKRSLRPPPQDDPFDVVFDRDDAVRSLAALSPRQRAAVVVTELLGYSSREAGAILGLRPGTVRSLTSQARAALLEWKERNDV